MGLDWCDADMLAPIVAALVDPLALGLPRPARFPTTPPPGPQHGSQESSRRRLQVVAGEKDGGSLLVPIAIVQFLKLIKVKLRMTKKKDGGG